MALGRRRIVHRRDRLLRLRAFCEAVRFGSIARAAQHLGLGPPAVMLHVRVLVHEFEAVVLDRGGRGVTPTVAGERFHALAEPLVAGMQGLPAALSSQLDIDRRAALDSDGSPPTDS